MAPPSPAAPTHPAPAHPAPRLQPPRQRRRWLLLIPIGLPLLVPVYNRIEPQLWGMPFFYWYQLACAVVAILVTTAVHQLTKEGR